jgi:hypothetical protein
MNPMSLYLNLALLRTLPIDLRDPQFLWPLAMCLVIVCAKFHLPGVKTFLILSA